MSKKYVSVLKDSAATPGYRIIAPEDYVYTENGTKKVKKIDSKADKKVPATAGNLATLDSTGNLADSGKQTTDFMNALTTAYEASGSATKTVTKVTQAKTGAVTVTYSDIQSGTTSQKGLVQLEDSTSSTSVTKAATPNSVKSAYDLANGKYSKPSGGIPSSDMDSAVQASLGKADTAIQGVKLNGSTLTPSSAKVVDLGNLKTKQTAVSDPSASGTTITAIATISQDANGVITATKKTIQSASQSQDGVMSAADKTKLDGIATGAEVNQNAFSNVKVGDVTVVADTKTDTLTLAAGSNVTITPDATNDKITIAAKDTTYTADAGIKLDGTVFKHTNSVSGGTVGPTTDTAGATLSVPYVTYDSQGHVTASGTRTHNVGTASTSGAGIVQLQDSIDATTSKAATPNAVKKAIEALDVASVGGSGKYISAISETDGKISATSTTMDTTPTASSENAVTSGGIKAALDGKINVGAAVIFGDAVYRRVNESGNGWNKLAETTFTRAHTNAFGFFDVYYGQLGNPVGQMSVNFNVRADANGSKPSIKNASYFKVSGQDTYDICIVCRGLVGNVTVEIWGYLPTANISMAVVFRAHTNAQDDWKFALSKSKWTFYNYSGTSTSKPVADTSTNVQVVDATGTIIQKAVASPVNNNLVAMDANGLVKDSGKSVADLTNVQADWDATSGDAFIKNKPFYRTYVTSNSIKKVCTVTKRDSAGSVEAIGIDFISRRYAGAIRGRLTYKTGWSIYLEKCGNVSLTNSSVSIYYAIDGDDSSKIVVYARIGSYVEFCCAPAINYPKSYVNFDSFGTVVSALPEGATEITPVWVANSASSSGTAPVKVDEYGALTPVPMDSTPTVDSPNLVTSGGVKTALDTKADKVSITGATSCKITYNSQGIVTAGTVLSNTDLPKFIYNYGYASTRMNGAPAYASSTPYKLIARKVFPTDYNHTAWQRFMLMWAEDILEFKLYGRWSNQSTNPTIYVHPLSLYSSNGMTLSDFKDVFCPRCQFTPNTSGGLIIEFYIKFSSDWQNCRLYQLPAQGGDAGASELHEFNMYINSTPVASLPYNAMPFYENDDKVTVYGSASSTTVSTSNDTKIYLAGALASSYVDGSHASLKTDTGIYATTNAGELNATQYKVAEHCTMSYNPNKSSLDFSFS